MKKYRSIAAFILSTLQFSPLNCSEILMESSDSWLETWCFYPPTAFPYTFCHESRPLRKESHAPSMPIFGLETCSDNVDCERRIEGLKILHLTMHSGAKWEMMGIAQALGMKVIRNKK